MKNTIRNKKKGSRYAIAFPVIAIVIGGFFLTFSSFYEKSWMYNWDGISQPIKDSVLVTEHHINSFGNGRIEAKRPIKYDRNRWIMKNATEEELLKLIEYPNGTIRTIAYEGLMRNPEFDDKYNLFLMAISDKEYSIEFSGGCLNYDMYIGTYLMNYIVPIGGDFPALKNGQSNPFGISKEEEATILDAYRKELDPEW
ncbi:MAG: hypothetical protein ACI857_003076 [Arenicella sp.]|jgi:hypothetical protein